MLLCLIYF